MSKVDLSPQDAKILNSLRPLNSRHSYFPSPLDTPNPALTTSPLSKSFKADPENPGKKGVSTGLFYDPVTCHASPRRCYTQFSGGVETYWGRVWAGRRRGRCMVCGWRTKAAPIEDDAGADDKEKKGRGKCIEAGDYESCPDEEVEDSEGMISEGEYNCHDSVSLPSSSELPPSATPTPRINSNEAPDSPSNLIRKFYRRCEQNLSIAEYNTRKQHLAALNNDKNRKEYEDKMEVLRDVHSKLAAKKYSDQDVLGIMDLNLDYMLGRWLGLRGSRDVIEQQLETDDKPHSTRSFPLDIIPSSNFLFKCHGCDLVVCKTCRVLGGLNVGADKAGGFLEVTFGCKESVSVENNMGRESGWRLWRGDHGERGWFGRWGVVEWDEIRGWGRQ